MLSETGVPASAFKPGQKNLRAFVAARGMETTGVISALEPHAEGHPPLFHCSISRAVHGVPHKLTAAEVREVLSWLADKGVEVPAEGRRELTRFEAGPFACRGVHVWEIPQPAAPAAGQEPDTR